MLLAGIFLIAGLALHSSTARAYAAPSPAPNTSLPTQAQLLSVGAPRFAAPPSAPSAHSAGLWGWIKDKLSKATKVVFDATKEIVKFFDKLSGTSIGSWLHPFPAWNCKANQAKHTIVCNKHR